MCSTSSFDNFMLQMEKVRLLIWNTIMVDFIFRLSKVQIRVWACKRWLSTFRVSARELQAWVLFGMLQPNVQRSRYIYATIWSVTTCLWVAFHMHALWKTWQEFMLYHMAWIGTNQWHANDVQRRANACIL